MEERLNNILIKKAFLTLIGVTVSLTFLISSCRTTNNVVFSNLIQKRKYNSGYFVNIFSKSPKTTETKIKDKKTAIKTENEQEIQTNNSTDLIASTDNSIISNQKSLECQSNGLISSNNNEIQQIFAVQKREMACFSKNNIFNHLSADTSNGRPKVNWKAKIGLYYGLIGLPIFLIIKSPKLLWYSSFAHNLIFIIIPIFMIIICALALHQINKRPDKWKGKGYAIVGLCFGILLLAIEVFHFLLGILLIF